MAQRRAGEGWSPGALPPAAGLIVRARHVAVLVVDDHARVRTAIVSLLAKTDDLKIVGEAGDGVRAVALARERQPDVVLVDLSTSRSEEVHATRQLRAVAPSTRVLILTAGISYYEALADALAAGAVGYVLKDAAPGELLRAIRAVAREQDGGPRVPPAHGRLASTQTPASSCSTDPGVVHAGDIRHAGRRCPPFLGLRASDADRERFAHALQQHFLAGRLDLDEFSQRVESVYAARTLGELDALVYDLPTLTVPPHA